MLPFSPHTEKIVFLLFFLFLFCIHEIIIYLKYIIIMTMTLPGRHFRRFYVCVCERARARRDDEWFSRTTPRMMYDPFSFSFSKFWNEMQQSPWPLNDLVRSFPCEKPISKQKQKVTWTLWTQKGEFIITQVEIFVFLVSFLWSRGARVHSGKKRRRRRTSGSGRTLAGAWPFW